ncbi:MAG: alpha/beta hydrolase [Pseudomonadota bacterium]|nr:alpha/beta hydrolase [Pseudomonadota bacterium]
MSEKNRVGAVLGVLVALGSGVAVAQDISTYYTVMHPEEFKIDWKAAYTKANELTQATRKRLPHELDVAYGADRKQHLDIYLPKNQPKDAPVLIFLHGGGNREGDRAQYGYVADPFAQHGIVTVVASYRLQPASPWPAQRDDAQAIVAWVYHNIERYGGDPEKIYLSGHSAGSNLTAILAYRDAWRKQRSLPRDVLKGVALHSAVASEPRKDISDPQLAAETDVLRNTTSPPRRNVLAAGGEELKGAAGEKARQATEQMAQQLRAMGATANVVFPEGLDHATLVLSLADASSELTKAMLAMIESDRASSSDQ